MANKLPRMPQCRKQQTPSFCAVQPQPTMVIGDVRAPASKGTPLARETTHAHLVSRALGAHN